MEIFDYRKLNLQSCDILACSGDGEMSKGIQNFQRIVGFRGLSATLSHVAGVVKLTYQQVIDLRHLTGEWIDIDPDGLYVFESTTLNDWCGKKGVQINPMNLWLENYNGKVYVRQLEFERTPEFYKRDLQFIAEHIHDEYENGIAGGAELLFCGLMLSRFIRPYFPKWKPRATKTPHCSENEAKRGKCHKLLADIAIENRMPPAVWDEIVEKDEKRMHLEHATLDENILVPIGEMKRIK